MTQRKKSTSLIGNKKRYILANLLISLLLAGNVCAETDTAEAETDQQESAIKTEQYASLQSGYRFVTPDGPFAAASPYGRHKSGVSAGFSAGSLGSDLKLLVDGNFLHEDDYHTEGKRYPIFEIS